MEKNDKLDELSDTLRDFYDTLGNDIQNHILDIVIPKRKIVLSLFPNFSQTTFKSTLINSAPRTCCGTCCNN